MSDAAMGGIVFGGLFGLIVSFICFIIGVLILRWAFRINDIVARLDRMVLLMENANPLPDVPKAEPTPDDGPKLSKGFPYVHHIHQ